MHVDSSRGPMNSTRFIPGFQFVLYMTTRIASAGVIPPSSSVQALTSTWTSYRPVLWFMIMMFLVMVLLPSRSLLPIPSIRRCALLDHREVATDEPLEQVAPRRDLVLVRNGVVLGVV